MVGSAHVHFLHDEGGQGCEACWSSFLNPETGTWRNWIGAELLVVNKCMFVIILGQTNIMHLACSCVKVQP